MEKVGQKNYFFCYGTSIANYDQPTSGMFGPDATWAGPVPQRKIADVMDGLSNTFAMSERSGLPPDRRLGGNLAFNTTNS